MIRKDYYFQLLQNDQKENTYYKLETLTLKLMPTGLDLPGSDNVSLEACAVSNIYNRDIFIREEMEINDKKVKNHIVKILRV